MLFHLIFACFALLASAQAATLKSRQTTRRDVVRRATRPRSAKRATTSPVPILCGTGQQFKLLYTSVPGVDRFAQQGKYAVVRPQFSSPNPNSPSREMSGDANPSDPNSGQVFTLDSSCRLVTVGGPYPNYYLNANVVQTSTKLYFSTLDDISGNWATAFCSISALDYRLSCTSGSKANLNTCTLANNPDGISRGALHIAVTPLSNCQTVTIMAVSVGV